MGDTFPFLPLPKGRLAASSRQHRSTSRSPTRQRPTDDILSSLSPSAAVDALQHPSGQLKICLDSATPTEQSYALKAAIASKNVEEWLHEISEWPWPSGGGSAGFEIPTAKRRRVSNSPEHQLAPPSPDRSWEGVLRQGAEDTWLGSLRATDVSLYERRIGDIERELEDLEVEELKKHVLHHHILPLSRPTTPMSDTARLGGFSFNKMDDLAAIVTAIVMQILPNLSKLMRLMNMWSLRILILHRIPSMLRSLGDAEVALNSGWDATRKDLNLSSASSKVASPEGASVGASSTLTRQDFTIMRLVVEKKMGKAASDIDFMLDVLDGVKDTIPDEWIDRMDSLERQYLEWVAICEREIGETHWTQSPEADANRSLSAGGKAPSPHLDTENGNMADVAASGQSEAKDRSGGSIQLLPTTNSPVQTLDGGLDMNEIHSGRTSSNTGLQLDTRSTTNHDDFGAHKTDTYVARPESDNLQDNLEASPSSTPISRSDSEQSSLDEPSRIYHDLSSRNSLASLRTQPSLPSMHGDQRLDTETSIIVHGPHSGLDMSSDQADSFEGPELARFPQPATQDANDNSPPSSPPDFKSSFRSTLTFNDMPTVVEESSPRTPLMSSFMDDTETSLQIDSPRRANRTNEDDQLQQQISDILDAIPAKIKLSAEPPPVNHLNPPDLQLPKMKRSSVGPPDSARSHSSMSSRAGTPSFLLAPAYARNTRARQQKGNSGIKLYHLSRSTGEAPIKLFIRLVGENGERVMVRVGGGWADLGEYLKEYASHHSRRSKNGKEGKVEIRDLPALSSSKIGSSPGGPSSRPGSVLDSPLTPLNVRKTRKSVSEDSLSRAFPKTPLVTNPRSSDTPVSTTSNHSRSSSRLSWTEEDSSLGMSGPKGKNIEMSEESRAWVESVKEKVRFASGELKAATSASDPRHVPDGRFGDMGKVGGTKRVFRKGN